MSGFWRKIVKWLENVVPQFLVVVVFNSYDHQWKYFLNIYNNNNFFFIAFELLKMSLIKLRFFLQCAASPARIFLRLNIPSACIASRLFLSSCSYDFRTHSCNSIFVLLYRTYSSLGFFFVSQNSIRSSILTVFDLIVLSQLNLESQ